VAAQLAASEEGLGSMVVVVVAVVVVVVVAAAAAAVVSLGSSTVQLRDSLGR
jgi:hypothetical protein